MKKSTYKISDLLAAPKNSHDDFIKALYKAHKNPNYEPFVSYKIDWFTVNQCEIREKIAQAIKNRKEY